MSSSTTKGSCATYCVYEAPSEEIVRDHSTQARPAHDRLSSHEIAGDVTPADFPPV